MCYNRAIKQTEGIITMNTNFIGTISATIDNQELFLAMIDGVVVVKTAINYDGSWDNSNYKTETIPQWSEFYAEGGEVVVRTATGDDLWHFDTDALDEFEAATGYDLETL